MRLGRRIDDVIDRLHREIEGHELDDRPEAAHRRAGADAGEAVFGDRGVDHPPGSEFLEQPLGDLVGALVLGDFLADHEYPVVPAHFFGHRVAQRLAHGDGGHGGAGGNFRLRRLRGSLGELVGARRRGALGGFRFDGLLLLRRLFGRGDRVRRLLALAVQHRDDRADLHVFGPLRHHDPADGAFVDRFEFHRRLVGLDFGDDVSRLDLVAFLDQPLGERALFHRRRERGHLQFDRHRQ